MTVILNSIAIPDTKDTLTNIVLAAVANLIDECMYPNIDRIAERIDRPVAIVAIIVRELTDAALYDPRAIKLAIHSRGVSGKFDEEKKAVADAAAVIKQESLAKKREQVGPQLCKTEKVPRVHHQIRFGATGKQSVNPRRREG